MHEIEVTMNPVKPKVSTRSDAQAGTNPRNRKSEKVAKQVDFESIQEINGPAGLEPTRYGDWEVKGRCSDF